MPAVRRRSGRTRCGRTLVHTDEVFTAVFHPGGTWIASPGCDETVWLRVWLAVRAATNGPAGDAPDSRPDDAVRQDAGRCRSG
jgi:hypothetical protein